MGVWIRDPGSEKNLIRIPGSKRYRIPDSDPQHWFVLSQSTASKLQDPEYCIHSQRGTESQVSIPTGKSYGTYAVKQQQKFGIYRET
jgi:hypothetical protein